MGEGSSFEHLEQRRLFAWGQIAQTIGQDAAATAHPSNNGAGVTVVDLDTGTNLSHPALAGRIWTNPHETPGNGKDDDGDGLVDNVHGWNYVGSNNDVSDDQGHGTMTAGIMVANPFTNTGNNRGYGGDGKRYAGVAWGAKLITLKVADARGAVHTGHVEAALAWVAKNAKRFRIAAVNMSLGLEWGSQDRVEDELRAVHDAGVFVGASSGNGYNTNDVYSYPASSGYATSVGATTPDDRVASITSRGKSLDLLAPGSAVPYLDRGSTYWLSDSATSYAAPFVTGAAAVLKQARPSLTPPQIRRVLRETGRAVHDPSTGLTFKRIDLKRALDAVAADRTPQAAAPKPSTGSPPAAKFTSKTISRPARFHDFTVTYTMRSKLKRDTIDDRDILVTGPARFRSMARVRSVTLANRGRTAKVVYRVAAGDDAFADGRYRVSLRAGEVLDALSRPVAGKLLGTFRVQIRR